MTLHVVNYGDQLSSLLTQHHQDFRPIRYYFSKLCHLGISLHRTLSKRTALFFVTLKFQFVRNDLHI